MVAESPIVTAPRGRRAHWKTLGFAAAGVGFSSLIFTGMVGAFKEETFFHFAFVLVILVIASLVFLDRIAEVVLGGHGEKPGEKAGDRARILVWTVGVAILIVVLHRSIDAALRNDADAIGQLLASGLLSSCVTAAWLLGARHRPSRAARYGGLAGALVGGALGFLIAVFIYFGGDIPGVNTTPPPAFSDIQQVIYRVIMVLVVGLIVPVLWAGFGFMGGLAIDRRWGSTPTRGILFGLCLMAFPVSFGLFSYSYFSLHTWDPEPLRMIFMAAGWGVGLILHGDVCDDTLNVTPDLVLLAESSTIASGAALRPRPRPNPIWEVILIAGLSVAVLLLWHQSVKVKFFESDKDLPAPAARRYQTQFARSSTRVINFEMEIPKKLLPAGDFQMQEVWTGPIGTVSNTDSIRDGEEHPIGRYGWIVPGNWPAGSYIVELRLSKPGDNQNPQAQPSFGPFPFEIVNANVAPPPSHPDSQTPTTGADLSPQEPAQTLHPVLPHSSPDSSSQVPFQKRPANITPSQPSPPTLVPMEVFMQNARTSLAHGNLISPQNDNALYWVRRAKQISPQDVAAIQIENMILTEGVRIVERQHKAQNYDSALRLLASLESLYPDHAELRRLKLKIWIEQEQHQYQKTRSQ